MKKKATHYFFLCNIENDVLICAGISNVIKKMSSESQCHLLLPEHPRVKNKMGKYYEYFDEIIILPYCFVTKNIIRGIYDCNKFLSQFRQIIIPESSIFFMFNIYELTELLIYNEIKKPDFKTRIKRVVISAFESGESDPENVRLEYKKSIFYSIYSLLFCHNFFRVYKTINTNATGIHYYPAKWHFQLCIEDSKEARTNSINNYMGLPYPTVFLKPKNQTVLLEDNSLLILVNSTIPRIASIPKEIYFDRVNDLIEFLLKNYKNQIYVKDHPGFHSESKKWIRSEDVRHIDKEITVEELCLSNKDNLMAIFGYASTGLITASWMRIRVFNMSKYFGIQGALLERWGNFMSIASKIKNVDNLNEIRLSQQDMKTMENERLEERRLKVWEQVIQRITSAN